MLCLYYYPNVVCFCLKQAKIFANGVRKIILFAFELRKNFLVDIFACFKQKLTTFG